MQNEISVEQLNGLIDSAKDGNTRSFEMIVRTFQRYAFAVSFKILCSEEEAKDIVQESFIRIWKHLNRYDSKVKFTTWMYKIVVNLCYDRLRMLKRRNDNVEFITDGFELMSAEDNPEIEFTNKEMAELIMKISGGLPEKQRIIFVLRDLENLSISEVTEITGMSESSVKTNLVYARRNIKEKLIKLVK